MIKILSNLSITKKLGILALALGFFAIFAGSPYESYKVSLNAKDLAMNVERNAEDVSVNDLANWIIQGKYDFRLIDVRTPQKYTAYHIPTSQNLQLPDLLNQNFLPTDKVVLYSDNDKKAVIGWFLLKSKKIKAAYILKGGLKEWESQILFPKLPANPTVDQLSSFNKIKEVSKFFGGTPQTGESNEQKEPSIKKLPKLQLPANIPTGGARKKRKEGC